jgi:hypothetical protein
MPSLIHLNLINPSRNLPLVESSGDAGIALPEKVNLEIKNKVSYLFERLRARRC